MNQDVWDASSLTAFYFLSVPLFSVWPMFSYLFGDKHANTKSKLFVSFFFSGSMFLLHIFFSPYIFFDYLFWCAANVKSKWEKNRFRKMIFYFEKASKDRDREKSGKKAKEAKKVLFLLAVFFSLSSLICSVWFGALLLLSMCCLNCNIVA